MASFRKVVALALGLFAFAALIALGSPGTPAHAVVASLEVEKDCGEDVTEGQTFDVVVTLDVEVLLDATGVKDEAGDGPDPVDVDDVDVSDAVITALGGEDELTIELTLECGDSELVILPTFDQAISVNVGDVINDAFFDTDVDIPNVVAGDTLADLEALLGIGFTIALTSDDDCDENTSGCVDVEVTGTIAITATVTEPEGDPDLTECGEAGDGVFDLVFEEMVPEQPELTCTILNEEDPDDADTFELTVEKECEGDTPPEGPFDIQVGPVTLAFDCGDSETFDVPAGTTITIEEVDAADAEETAILCGDDFTQGAEAEVEVDADITCTVINSSEEIEEPDGDGDGDGDEDDGGIDINNNNTNLNNNQNNNNLINDNINTNTNTNANTQEQENKQDQNNDNNQVVNVNSSPSVNISGSRPVRAPAPAPVALPPTVIIAPPQTGEAGVVDPMFNETISAWW